MAPELSLDEPTASTKSDVYSFGVILLETISLMCATSQKGRPRNPTEWLNRTQGTELRDLFNTQLVDGDLKLMVATRCVLVGLMCCLPDPAGRPSMQQVVEMLAGPCEQQKDSTSIASSSSTASQATSELSSYPFLDDLSSTSALGMEGSYKVLTQDDLRSRQQDDIHNVAEFLSITPGLAAILLRHCQWTRERVQSEWFDHGDAFRVAVGLPSPWEEVSARPKLLTRGKPNCLCFDNINAGHGRAARSAGCSHYYCDDCWRRYIRVEMDEGPCCLPLRCPDRPFCEAPIVRELVVDVVHDADTIALYDQFMLLSYVDNSTGRIKWCPGRGCSRAVEFLFLGSGGGYSMEVLCECGHSFCWNCGVEPHRPVPCDAAREWLDKNKSRASPDDQALEKALRDMEDLKHSWLGNMADTLGIEVMDLGFLLEAYEEIAECRRRIRWVHAYAAYYLDPYPQGRRSDKSKLFDRLLQEANDSLERLQVCAKVESMTLTLCANDTEMGAISETYMDSISKTYMASRTKVMDLTRETQQHFEKLVKAAETDVPYY